MAQADVMATSMHSKNVQSFLKNVSKTYKKVTPTATNVSGATNPSSMSAMWKVHFESLLNSVNSDVNLQHVKECVQNVGNFYNDNNIHITPCMVQNAIDTLKSGNSCGNDGLLSRDTPG